MLDLFRLDGTLALVTGAGRGLGQAIALALAEAGAVVVGLDRGDGEQTAAAVRAIDRPYHHLTHDLGASDAADLNALVAFVERDYGELSILVNNAGIIRRAPAIAFSEADWDAVMQVNLRSVFFLAQAAARVMLPRKHGKIINLASMLSFQGGVFVPSYTAAKSGVAGLTRALANEWAAAGVNVNAIAPGYMATDNTAPLRADERRAAAILERIPAGRWGVPADLAGAAVFLASRASDYVHGQILAVDGGWLAR